MAEIKSSDETKRLFSILLQIGLPNFLVTKHFELICMDNDIDDEWTFCLDHAYKESTVAVLMPGYTGYVEKALALFLNRNYNHQTFLQVLDTILIAYKDWLTKKGKVVDFHQVKNRLEELGYEMLRVKKMKIFERSRESFDQYALSSQEIRFTKTVNEISKLCFILMPFDERFQPIYAKIIKAAVEECGLKCARADEIFGAKPIITDIWEYVQKAKFLIADLTDRNPNVFYELGLAHALNKEVILITQSLNDVPFDLKHIRCIQYQDSAAGGEQLKDYLIKTIKSLGCMKG